MRAMTKQTNSYSFSFSFPDVKLSNFPRFLGSSWGLGIEVILKYDRRHHSIVSTKDGNTTSNNVIDNTAAPVVAVVAVVAVIALVSVGLISA